MTNVNQNNQNVKPIRFELVDDEPEKTLGDVILCNIEDMRKKANEPKFRCPRCLFHFTFRKGDYCDWCIDDIVNDEGE